MNNKIIEIFALRYSANINLQPDRGRFDTYSRSMDYYDNDRSTVEISLTMQAFKYMVETDIRAEEDYQKIKQEARIRRHYPAVADAYDKYKMLLELCK